MTDGINVKYSRGAADGSGKLPRATKFVRDVFLVVLGAILSAALPPLITWLITPKVATPEELSDFAEDFASLTQDFDDLIDSRADSNDRLDDSRLTKFADFAFKFGNKYSGKITALPLADVELKADLENLRITVFTVGKFIKQNPNNLATDNCRCNASQYINKEYIDHLNKRLKDAMKNRVVSRVAVPRMELLSASRLSLARSTVLHAISVWESFDLAQDKLRSLPA